MFRLLSDVSEKPRLWLVLVLILIVVGIVVVAKQEVHRIWYVDVSPDGKRVAITKLNTFNRPQTGQLDRGRLEVWDLTTRRRLFYNTDPSSFGSLDFSPDGKTLAVGGFNQDVSLWDVATGQKIKTLDHTEVSLAWVFYGRDGNVIYTWFEAPIKLWDAKTGKTTDTIERFQDENPVFAQKTNRIGVVVGFDRKLSRADVKIFDVVNGRFEEVRSLKVRDGLTDISPDGNRIAVSRFGNTIDELQVEILDVASEQIVLALTMNSREFNDLAFSPDSKALAVAANTGKIQVWDLATGQPKATRVGNSVWRLWRIDFLPDGESLIAVDFNDQTATIWNSTNGMEEKIYFRNRWLPLWTGIVTVAFALWTIVWVRSQAQRKRSYRPLGDVLLLHGIVLGAFWLRITSGAAPNLDRPAGILFQTVAGGLVGLFVLWIIFGGLRWSMRVAVFVVAFACAWAFVMFSWQDQYGRDLHLLVVAVCTLGCEIAGLKLWQLFGTRVVHESGDRTAILGGERRGKFTILDILLWLTAVALLLTVARFAVLRPIDLKYLGLLLVMGCSEAATAVTAIWAGLGASRWWIRLSVGAFVVAACALLFSSLVVDVVVSWWWYVGLHVVRATCIVLSLSIFRLHGYQLIRKPRIDTLASTAPSIVVA